MTPAEQHYGSVRYVYRPLLIIELPSGEVAVGKGYNPFDLIAIFPSWEEALPFIQENARTRIESKPEPIFPSLNIEIEL